MWTTIGKSRFLSSFPPTHAPTVPQLLAMVLATSVSTKNWRNKQQRQKLPEVISAPHVLVVINCGVLIPEHYPQHVLAASVCTAAVAVSTAGSLIGRAGERSSGWQRQVAPHAVRTRARVSCCCLLLYFVTVNKTHITDVVFMTVLCNSELDTH